MSEPTPEEVKAAHDWFEDLVYDVTRLIDPLDPNLEIVEPAIRKERDAVSENFMLVIRAAVEAETERCAKEVEAFTKLPLGWKAAITAAIRFESAVLKGEE